MKVFDPEELMTHWSEKLWGEQHLTLTFINNFRLSWIKQSVASCTSDFIYIDPPPPVFRKWHYWIRQSTMNTESILPLVTMITNINITLLIILYQSLIYIYINIIKRILLIKYPLKIISTSIQWNEIFANLWGLKIQNSYTLKGSYRTFDYSWIKFNILILLPWQYNENELDIFFHQISMMQ